MERDPGLEALANTIGSIIDNDFNDETGHFIGAHAERDVLYVTTEHVETHEVIEYRAKLERL